MGIRACLLGAGESSPTETRREGRDAPPGKPARGRSLQRAELSRRSPRTVNEITVELGTQLWVHPWLPSRNVSPVW